MAEELRFCDLCGEPASSGDRDPLLELEMCMFPGSKDSKLLNTHLRVYFIASRLLKCSKQNALKVIGDGGHDREVDRDDEVLVRCCNSCEETVDKAWELHWKVVALQREISALGEALLCKIESWASGENTDSSGFTGAGWKLRKVVLKKDLAAVNVKVERETCHDESPLEEDDTMDFDDDGLDQFDYENARRKLKNESGLYDSEGGEEDEPSEWEIEVPRTDRKNKKRQKSKHILSADGNFHCDMCESVYTTIPGITKHDRMHRESNMLGNIYDCTICRHPNLSDSKLRRHLTLVHGKVQASERTHNYDPLSSIHSDNGEESDFDYNPQSDMPIATRKDTYYVASADGNFRCDLCESVYTTVPGIKKHDRMHNESNLIGNMYDCTICRHPNLSESKLRRHMTMAHNISQKACEQEKTKQFEDESFNPDCHAGQEDLNSIEKYTYVPSSDGTFRCDLCESVYTTIPGIKKHDRMHRESTLIGKIYDCSICRHPNLSASKLRRHMTMVHNTQIARKDDASYNSRAKVKEDSDSDYIPELDEEEPLPKRGRLHVPSADGSFRCDLCESVYTTVPGIKKHGRMHRESDLIGNKYDCTICRHPNLSESKLSRHMSVVHEKLGESKSKDDSSSNSGLRDPLSIHKDSSTSANNENHVCHLCKSPVVYTSNHGFRRHLRIHEQSNLLGNIFDCLICGHPTVSESNLRRHLTVVHQRMEASKEHNQMTDLSSSTGSGSAQKSNLNAEHVPKKDKIFTCELCESIYTSIVGYRKHLRIHEESELLGKQYDCPTCRHPNVSESNLRRHMTAVHQIKSTVEQQVEVETSDGSSETNLENDSPLTQTEDQICENKKFFVKASSEKFRCKLCKSVYTTLPGILKHGRMHKESRLLGKLYDCKICRHPNLSDSKLRRHMTKIHGMKGWKRKTGTLQNTIQQRTTTREMVDGECSDKESESESDIDRNDDEWLPYAGKEDATDVQFEGTAKKLSETKDQDNLRYRCLKCNVGYRSFRGYERHKKEHEISESLGHKYDCYCGFPASSEKKQRHHKRWAHSDTFVCYVCEHQAQTKEELKEHMKEHYSSGTIGKRGKGRKVVMCRKKGFGRRVCNICKTSYWYRLSFKRHMSDHEQSKLLNGKWDCLLCSFPCLSEKQLNHHMTLKHKTLHEKQRRVACTICQKMFPNSDLLVGHMRIHAEYDDCKDPETGLFRCKLCPYIGLNIRALLAHKSALHRDSLLNSDHLCAQCGKAFYSPAALKKHIRNIHENKYTYRCEHCGKGFDSKGSFNCHKLTHTEDRTKDHICDACGAAYSHKHSLQIHIAKIHSAEAKNMPAGVRDERRYPTEKEHVCKLCKMVFPFKYMLVNHIPSAHQDRYTFGCDQCDKKYLSASSLRLHKDITHTEGKNSYSCEYCQKVFIHRQYVLSHYRHCNVKRNADQLKNQSSSSNQ